jgi:hypothetical protein
MVQWITLSTHSDGVVNSSDRGLASPAKQPSIPRSGSFTEVCSVFSEGWMGLGRTWLAGLRRQGLGWPRTRRRNEARAPLEGGCNNFWFCTIILRTIYQTTLIYMLIALAVCSVTISSLVLGPPGM